VNVASLGVRKISKKRPPIYLMGGSSLPLLMYDKFQAGQVNFPHLVERVSLIVIIAFGEAIVNLASYFNSETPITYAVLLFVSLCSMFAAM
ncbi:low temperature requirement protein A, partial [Lactobacillus amylovorus]